jgi:transcriptional regulator with XRE-family HTH domain
MGSMYPTRPERPRRGAADLDRRIGERVRQRRILLGLTQQQLAELIGVTYQQAHKYESGINRISSGRLLALAQALGVDVGYLLQGLGDGQQQSLRLERRMIQIAADLEKLDEETMTALATFIRALARRQGGEALRHDAAHLGQGSISGPQAPADAPPFRPSDRAGSTDRRPR